MIAIKKPFLKQPLSNQEKSGFTLIEFSLVIAFIAILLITIAIITSSIMQIYQKGLTVKAVNSVGRGLIDEFTSSINAAPAVDTTSLCNSFYSDSATQDACAADHAYQFVYQQVLDNDYVVARDGSRDESSAGEGADNIATVQLGGIFCTGKYSYIWNTYYGQQSNQTLSLVYRHSDGSQDTLTDFRLARFPDETYRLCSATMNQASYTSTLTDSNRQINITTLVTGQQNNLKEDPQQGFLNSFDLDLQLYEFVIFPLSQDWVTQRTFMSGTFILATERGNINIERSGNYCDIHDLDSGDDASQILDLGAEFTYCAINKFNFAARTAGM